MKKLQLAKAPDLCFTCHKAMKEKMAKEKVHSPAEDCLNCHSPHYSVQKAARHPAGGRALRAVPRHEGRQVLEGAPRHRPEEHELHQLPQPPLLEGPQVLQGGGARAVRGTFLRRLPRRPAK